MNLTRIETGIQFLAQAGLNLFASLDCATLPEAIRRSMQEGGVPLADYGRLVMTGHGGRQLWRQLKRVGLQTPDPVDRYSLKCTQQFIQDYLEDADHLLLYPGSDHFIPLVAIGELAGWSQPSPLGQGIQPEFGLWFAYRSAFLTNYDLPVIQAPPAKRPCDTCLEKPCISSCPSHAVQTAGFNVKACTDYRLEPASVCAAKCLARLACPIAPEHRYTSEQIQYHYLHSLETIRHYQTKIIDEDLNDDNSN